MKQRRWFELVKDYDCDIKYYSSKANIVTNVLNRKVFLSLLTAQSKIQTDLDREQIELVIRVLTRLEIKSMLKEEIKVAQLQDDQCK